MSDKPDLEKDYVLGFCMSGIEDNHNFVVLVDKQKPSWQKDRWNGPGGHMKEGEFIDEAMAREFREETGVDTDPNQWTCFGQMTFPDGSIVHCFIMTDSLALAKAQTQPGGETVHRLHRDFIRNHAKPLSNITWLIEMGMAKLREPNHPQLCVVYGG